MNQTHHAIVDGVEHTSQDNIGYIQYINSKRTQIFGAPVFDFQHVDNDRIRQGMLSLKMISGVDIYIKTGDTWDQVPKHFNHIRDTFRYWNLPYIVIVEYIFT